MIEVFQPLFNRADSLMRMPLEVSIMPETGEGAEDVVSPPADLLKGDEDRSEKHLKNSARIFTSPAPLCSCLCSYVTLFD
jgi:hypothetical protein